jgi:hypothetical protein
VPYDAPWSRLIEEVQNELVAHLTLEHGGKRLPD